MKYPSFVHKNSWCSLFLLATYFLRNENRANAISSRSIRNLLLFSIFQVNYKSCIICNKLVLPPLNKSFVFNSERIEFALTCYCYKNLETVVDYSVLPEIYAGTSFKVLLGWRRGLFLFLGVFVIVRLLLC